MFLGSFKYSIDTKGRISIPAKLRKSVSPEANDTFIMTPGIDKCIELRPMDEWKKFEKKIKKFDHFDSKQELYLRMLSYEAGEDKLDTQSRLLLPRNLIEHSELDKEVLIIGVREKIEVWNPKNYDAYINNSGLSYPDVAEIVMGNKEVKDKEEG